MRRHRTTRNLRVAVLGLAALVVAGSALAAGGAAQRRSHGPAETIRAALATLDLTPAQRARMRAIAADARRALRSLAEQRRADASALRAALAASPADPAVVGDAALRLRADRQAARAEMARVLEATRNTLTDEQRVRFDACLDAARALRPRRR